MSASDTFSGQFAAPRHVNLIRARVQRAALLSKGFGAVKRPSRLRDDGADKVKFIFALAG
jgi:hypothetical protein